MLMLENVQLHPNYFLEKIFYPTYQQEIIKNLVQLCPQQGRVLDVGCDDGSLAVKLMDKNPELEVIGIDIQENRNAQIPRKIYNGKRIPYPNNSFDTVITVDVLHHTKHIPLLLKEMKRVAKKSVIIKDHVSSGFFNYLVICFSDWITNVFQGIKCAFNYPSMQRWKKMFNNQKLKLEKVQQFEDSSGYDYIFKLKA